MAYPEPTEVAPWYLRNITQALELNTTTGQVFVRTGLSDAANIIITGNVTIPGEIDTHITAIGSLGNITTPYMPIGGNVNVDVITGNVTVVQGTSPWVVSGNVTVADGGGSITVDGNVGITGTVNANITGGNVATTIGGTNLDAFGRLRVSEPYTLFDSQNRYLDGGQFSNITANSGSIAYVANESSFNLAVSAANGSSVINQSFTTQAYQPGKSLLTMNTFAMATLVSGCRQRVGYFTAANGIYFEADGETLYLVIRSSTTGAVVEERIAQSSWNGDRLTGAGGATNPSGIDLDPTLTQIFWSDIEWLGVGNVRAGFIINGAFIVCHTFQHANQSGNTTVYMTTATLNSRYEITNTTATGGARTMKQICSTVISEGGYNPATTVNYVTNGTSVTRISSANTLTALASIRLNPAYPDAVVVPAQVDLLLLDVRYGQFQLIEGATFTTSFSNVTNSVVQTATHSNAITDGTVVYSGLTSSRDEVEVSADIKRRLQLRRDVSGTPITLTLAVAYTANNADLLWKLGWEELTN
jgi:hypothetical protein